MQIDKEYQCPVCHGSGGWIEPVLDYGEGPFFPCGGCDAKGRVNRKTFYMLLGCLSAYSKKYGKEVRDRLWR